MWKITPHLCLLLSLTTALHAEAPNPTSTPAPVLQHTTPFKPFAGKIITNKVRLRTQPTTDGPIVKELNKDDLFVIVGEKDDFYAVAPPKDTKAYIFRTFVLDNVVEGSRVNVRIEPNLDAPVIGQLNSGDKIDGTVSSINNKWLEIAPPSSTRFYIAKDYVEKIGEPEIIAKLERRKEEAKQLLANAIQQGNIELARQYNEINLQPVFANLNKLMTEYSDMPQYATRAKELNKQFQDAYLQKKVSYLENRASTPDSFSRIDSSKNEPAASTPNSTTLTQKPAQTPSPTSSSNTHAAVNAKMAAWNSAEEAFYNEWAKQQPNPTSLAEFYNHQREHAYEIKGVIEPYNRPIKNKPGDYVLINTYNNLPLAYLYSNQINLQEYAGQEVTVKASPRPNNHFAYPAYFVLEVNHR